MSTLLLYLICLFREVRMRDINLRDNLKRILNRKGRSQVDLAGAIGVAPNNLISRLARGRNCQLSLLESICEELGVHLDELVFGEAGDLPKIRGMKEHPAVEMLRQLVVEGNAENVDAIVGRILREYEKLKKLKGEQEPG
jgi:DNA-binding Xre family transcriptional regulator